MVSRKWRGKSPSPKGDEKSCNVIKKNKRKKGTKGKGIRMEDMSQRTVLDQVRQQEGVREMGSKVKLSRKGRA